MSRTRCSLALGLVLLATGQPDAQRVPGVTIRVAETSGIRRMEYPIRARVAVPQRVVSNATHVRLRLDDATAAAVPAQYTVAATWPDGSVQSLDVDFNATLAPAEARTYRLEYGMDVTAGAAPRGLAVTEDADVIQIGNVTFSRRGAPLMTSANYVRSEFIGQFPLAQNGFAIVDRDGARHDLFAAQPLNVELLERGPLAVVLRYAGSIPIDAGYAVPFTLLVDMPNSKSWVKMSATVTDTARRVRRLDFETPLAFGAFPWLWDFGTDNGTYGAFRNANDTVVFTQVVDGQGSNWKVDTGTQPDLRPYETSTRPAGPAPAIPAGRIASGWGHFQGTSGAVAFGIDGFGEAAGTYSITLNGQGQASYRFAPGGTATSHRFGVYQHFVSTPVPIGAATTPTSMLHPPTVAVSAN